MLLIDAGNSRIKWALVEGSQWVRQGAAGIAEWSLLHQEFSTLPQPRRILVSNVAGAEAAQQIMAVCGTWSCTLEFIQAKARQCGVLNTYEQPAQLGSDRWAALIAAWHLQRTACLVVSCGTATTIDALSGEGHFLGGLILPGLDMMLRSLVSGTAQLKAAEGEFCEFPRNTADALFSGALQATAGAIIRQQVLLGVKDACCLLTGGAAKCVQPCMDMPVRPVENLVLHGLHIIGQENL